MKFEEVLPALREGKTLKVTINGVVYTIPKDKFVAGYYLDSDMILANTWEVEKDKHYARMIREKGTDEVFVFKTTDIQNCKYINDCYEWVGDWYEISG